MVKQRKMRTLLNGDEAMRKTRTKVKIGEVVSFQGKKFKKVKGGCEEVSSSAWAHLVVKQL